MANVERSLSWACCFWGVFFFLVSILSQKIIDFLMGFGDFTGPNLGRVNLTKGVMPPSSTDGFKMSD